MERLIYILILLVLASFAYGEDVTLEENVTFNPSLSNVTYRMNRTFYGLAPVEVNETCLTLNQSVWCNSSAVSIIINVSEIGDQIPPIILNLRNTSTTNQSTYINWSCSENCNYSIYILKDSLRTDIFDVLYNSTFALSHNPYWDNLTNSTTYYINLTIWDSSGNYAANNIFSFTTAGNIVEAISEEAPPAIEGHIGGTGVGTTETGRVTLAKYGYPCPTDLPFFKRLFSGCTVKNNDICDDGEWYLVHTDCELDNVLFFSMWFLRVILTLSILFLVRDNKFFPVIAVFLLILFYLNGAFPMLEGKVVTEGAVETQEHCTGTNPLNTIFSRCKIQGNGVCDYGEHPFIDKECNLTINNVLFGNIFKEMWLIRLLFVIWLLLLIRREKYYLPVATIILVSLLATNPAIMSSLTAERGQCEGLNYLYNLRVCMSSGYPTLGHFLNETSPLGNISHIEPIETCKEDNAFSTIFSNCRIPKNGVCDYGEYPFKDNDCRLTANRVIFGSIFWEMWIVRVLLLISVIFLILRKRNYLLFIVAILLGLLLTNPAITSSLLSNEVSCDGISYLYNFGPCIAPKYPAVGWMIIPALLILLYITWAKLKKAPRKEPTSK